MGSNYFCFFICLVSPFVLLTASQDKRTEKCNTICTRIKIAATIGGCNCGLVLFTKRSSDLRRSVETEAETLKQLRHQILGKMDPSDSAEYELGDERQEEKVKKPSNSLIRLIENRILRPVLQEIDY